MNELMIETLKRKMRERYGVYDADLDALIDPDLTYQENLDLLCDQLGLSDIVTREAISMELERLEKQLRLEELNRKIREAESKLERSLMALDSKKTPKKTIPKQTRMQQDLLLNYIPTYQHKTLLL